jgi:large-conductance mechanosensitive channel
MIVIRFLLISLIVYLIIRSFRSFAQGNEQVINRSGQEKDSKVNSKVVSKEVGEYIDYEEVDK